MNIKQNMLLTLFAISGITLLISCDKDKLNTETAKNTLTNSTAMVSETTSANTITKVFAISKVSEPTEGKAVDFSWSENGKSKTFAEVTKGKAVLLNFWGTWCPPCRMEIPDLIKVNNELKNKEFVMIGIALERDQSNALKTVQSFAGTQKMDYYQFIDDTREIVKAYGGINAVPTTYIIDKDGKISETIVGMRDYDGFMSSIKRVMK